MPPHAGRLTPGGLKHAGQVVVQNGLRIVFVAAGGKEREGLLLMLQGSKLSVALGSDWRVSDLLFVILQDKT